MKVALIGAGAVGAYFIWGYGNSQNCGVDFCVIAEGERKEKYEKNGFRVNGVDYHPVIKTPIEAGKQDVIIVATKLNNIKETSKMLNPMIAENTVVMSMLNGAESEEILASEIGKDHIVHCIILIASRRFEKEVIFDTTYNTVAYYGAVDITNREYKLKLVEDAFAGTEINFERKEDIVYEIWHKYARNVCNNLPQTVVCAPSGIYTRSVHGYFIAEKLWQEVRSIARLKGVELEEHVELYELNDYTRYSTLQDIDNMRRTEVDYLCGYLIKLAKKAGIDVPYIEYTYHAIKLLEEKNDGLFS